MSLELIEGRRALEQEVGDILHQLPDGMGILIVRRGPNAGSTFALEAPSTTLGRDPGSDIFLDDVTVSRHHAVVDRVGDDFEVRDVGSLNGTYVDHERIETSKLQDMNELQVGRFVLTFVIGGSGESV